MPSAAPTPPIRRAPTNGPETWPRDDWVNFAMGPDDPRPGADWASYQAARERFFARVRPQVIRGQDGVNAR